MAGFDGDEYQARFDALSGRGIDVHGEAAFIDSFNPATVLDAGCGTGRVAIELARRGVSVVGADFDQSMIAKARRIQPALEWIEGDVSELRLDKRFDVVVMAGNVPIFCPGPRRAALIAACARHVSPGGRLISGFQLDRGYSLTDYDLAATAAGLDPAERWSTWDRKPFDPEGDYAVSVHCRPDLPSGA